MTDSRSDRAAAAYVSIVRASVILGVFTVLVLCALIANGRLLHASDPRNSAELKVLKLELHKHPKDQKVKARIRQVDLRLRREYIGRLDFATTGNYILLAGIVGLLILLPAAAQYRKRVSVPDGESAGPDEFRQAAMLGRKAVGVLGVAVVAGLVVLAATSPPNPAKLYAKAVKDYEKNPPPSFDKPGDPLAGLPPAMLQNLAGRPTAAVAPVAPVAAGQQPLIGAAPLALPTAPGLPPANPSLAGAIIAHPAAVKPSAAPRPEAAFDEKDYSPSAADYASNWACFRGPASGVVDGGYPVSWEGSSGKGVLWKTPISLPGWNSPVVWGDRVFLSGADKKKREIYCLDASSGKMVWKAPVANIGKGKTPEPNDATGYAASTMVADGRRVFAIFPNGDVVCYGFDGKRLWGRNLGTPESMYGYASSLATFRSLLIIQFDQGSGDDGKSALLALQGATGKIVWRTVRPVANSWSSPIVVRRGDQGMVITNANPWSIAYDALSGKEHWRAKLMSGDVAPSPAYAGDMAFVCNSGAVLAGIRCDGHGDVTKSVAWQASDGLPDISSPVSDGKLAFLATSEGAATCYDAKKGDKLWEHSFDEASFQASPVIVGDKVYLLDSTGLMIIIDAKATFKEIARSPLGETSQATPAFANGRIYIRGTKNLFCIGGK
jgi:outer membrane protein assembly factor BamB